MATIENRITQYAAAQAEVERSLLGQLKDWRQRFIPTPIEQDFAEEDDRLFAAQMAARLLEVSLRPYAVSDPKELRRLIRPFGSANFDTRIALDDITAFIAETRAILKGHFVLLGGQHSSYFFMFSRLGTRVEFRKKLASELARRFASLEVRSVVAPVTAGGLLVQDLAAELNADFAFFDVDNHSRPSELRRGYAVNGRTLIINDMTTTGGGVQLMIKTLREQGAEPVALGLIATRGSKGAAIARKISEGGLRVEALFHLDIESFDEPACECCRLGFPTIMSRDINR